jgi:hypothetical protein
MFGTQPAALCRPKNFLAKVLTPEFEDIGNCGPPLSITNITVTPIPGKYPFRILTYSSESVPVTRIAGTNDISEVPEAIVQNALDNINIGSVERKFRSSSAKKKAKSSILKKNLTKPNASPVFKLTDSDQILSKEFPTEFTIPIEQANYILDMPPESINVVSLVSGSLSAGDNTIFHLRTSIQPFQLNFAGSIDLEFSHVSETEGTSSKLNFPLTNRLFKMAPLFGFDFDSTCAIFCPNS